MAALLHEAATIGASHAQGMLKAHHRSVWSGTRDLLSRARDIVNGLLDHVNDAISKALGNEQDEEEQLSQADIVDATMNDLIEQLPELIAETETVSAIEQSVVDTLKDGGVQRIAWIAEPDACPMCLELAAQGPIPADSEWEGGISSPPLHPRCRCVVINAEGE